VGANHLQSVKYVDILSGFGGSANPVELIWDNPNHQTVVLLHPEGGRSLQF